MKSNVTQPFRNLLDHAGPDYCKAVEVLAAQREYTIGELLKDGMSNDHLHAVRGKIVAYDTVLATLGWEEAREKLR